jgi:hypothetical protein
MHRFARPLPKSLFSAALLAVVLVLLARLDRWATMSWPALRALILVVLLLGLLYAIAGLKGALTAHAEGARLAPPVAEDRSFRWWATVLGGYGLAALAVPWSELSPEQGLLGVIGLALLYLAVADPAHLQDDPGFAMLRRFLGPSMLRGLWAAFGAVLSLLAVVA